MLFSRPERLLLRRQYKPFVISQQEDDFGDSDSDSSNQSLEHIEDHGSTHSKVLIEGLLSTKELREEKQRERELR